MSGQGELEAYEKRLDETRLDGRKPLTGRIEIRDHDANVARGCGG